MEKLQWNSFTKKIYIKSSIERLYELWTTTEGITSWFLAYAAYKSPKGILRDPKEQIQKNDAYIWRWHNWDGQEEGTVLAANGNDFVEWSFSKSRVSVTLEQKNDITIVILKQFEIPEDDSSKLQIHYGCSNGWTFWLTNLKAYVEHGILLNETEVDLRKNELAGYQFVNM